MLAVTIRIARAATGREKIAFCGYHGWHDWYLATNLGQGDRLDGHLLAGLEPAGVPRGLAGTMFPFAYNRIEELRAIVAAHGPELAAIVMEPARNEGPAPGFLEEIRATASRIGAVLVFDEVTSGWRLQTSGTHMVYGVHPDLAAFGKAMSTASRWPRSSGRREVMDAAQRTFISSTYWTDRLGPSRRWPACASTAG